VKRFRTRTTCSSRKKYHYDQGQRLEVAVHRTATRSGTFFTDLDSGHRFKIPPEKYRQGRLRTPESLLAPARSPPGERMGFVFEIW